MKAAGSLLSSSPIVAQATDAIENLLHAALVPKRKNARATSDSQTSAPHLPNRREIVSRKLCDDSVKYLARSLEPWKGTTIVDINPGACVWSSSLHRLLKPKRHILLEPDAAYDPFIEPLVKQEGSRYHHIPIAGVHDASYFDVWLDLLKDPDALADRVCTDVEGRKLRELDTSLLITGNLWRFPVTRKPLNKYASNIISQTSWAAMNNEIFHNAGRVRMLWWLPEQQLPQLLASDSRCRTNFSVGLDLTADARHIVGCTPLRKLGDRTRDSSPRGAFLEDLVEREVRVRTRKHKIRVSNSRSEVLSMYSTYDEDEKSKTKPRKGFPNPLATSCKTLEDLAVLLDRHEHRRRQAFKSAAKLRHTEWPSLDDTYRRSAIRTSVWPQAIREVFRKDTDQYRSRWGLIFEIAASVDFVVELIHLEAEWLALSQLPDSDKQKLAELKERLRQADISWTTWTRPRLRRRDLQHIKALATHIQLYYAKPQPIRYDQRQFEPLRADQEDFWPPGKMALLDVIPRDIDMSIPDLASAREGTYACRQMIKHMFMSPWSTVADALSSLAPNAREDLLPQLEELADPKQGGRLDPSKVGVQSVHADTYRKMATLYKEWPFKPEVGYMSLQAEAHMIEREAGSMAEDSVSIGGDGYSTVEAAESPVEDISPLLDGPHAKAA